MRRADLDIDKQQGGGRAALAAACGVSRSTVGRWLDGQSSPNPEHFEVIAAALGIPVIQLLVGAGIISTYPSSPPNLVEEQPITPEEAATRLGILPDDRELFLTFVDQLQKRARRAE
jgi:transcriptional regulator with XRE-family HTH domain